MGQPAANPKPQVHTLGEIRWQWRSDSEFEGRETERRLLWLLVATGPQCVRRYRRLGRVRRRRRTPGCVTSVLSRLMCLGVGVGDADASRACDPAWYGEGGRAIC